LRRPQVVEFDEIVDRTRAMARQLKLNCLKDSESSDDIPTAVEVYREGEVAVVLMWSSAPNPEGLDQVAAAGFVPDVLTVVSDTLFAAQELNPRTGREWQDDELRALADDPAAWANGSIYEGLLVVAADRSSGRAFCEPLVYRRDGEAIEWLDSAVLQTARDDYRKRADRMLATMNSVTVPTPPPSAVQRARMDLGALDEIEKFYAGDGGQSPIIHVSMFAKPGTPRHQGLREKMAKGAIGDPRTFWAERSTLPVWPQRRR
jgi:hypothetical protein